MSDFRWAVVTQISPLRIQIEGDPAPLPITPDSLIIPMVGDRVRVEIANRRLLIHAASERGPAAAVWQRVGFAHVVPDSETILDTAMMTVAGLSLTGMPTGVPVVVEATVQTANGQWANTRSMQIQVMNGTSAAGPERSVALPAKSDETVGISFTHIVPVASPSSSSWSLQLGCDLAAAVVFWQATLTLYCQI